MGSNVEQPDGLPPVVVWIHSTHICLSFDRQSAVITCQQRQNDELQDNHNAQKLTEKRLQTLPKTDFPWSFLMRLTQNFEEKSHAKVGMLFISDKLSSAYIAHAQCDTSPPPVEV